MSDEKPRAYTPDEMRKMVLDHMRAMVWYWESLKDDGYGVRERLDGLAFSFLAMLDGSSAGVPSFDLVPRPHPDDEAFHRDDGDNWWPDGVVINDRAMLHEEWHEKAKP